MLDYEFWYIISIPLCIIFLIFEILKKTSWKTIFFHSLVFFYCVAVISIVIFPLPFQKELIEDSKAESFLHNNFIPFRSIIDIASNNSLFISMKQIVGNTILLLPFGFFTPFIWHSLHQFRKAFFVGLFTSTGIEIIQFCISFILGFTYKITDVDDIILNTVGFIFGYFFYKMFQAGSEDQTNT
ncbi:MAG TPA: VanZ family protein [Patescibacteria group bacterium]|nr:VanZ family protein [Patescibacteria group bacterium]